MWPRSDATRQGRTEALSLIKQFPRVSRYPQRTGGKNRRSHQVSKSSWSGFWNLYLLYRQEFRSEVLWMIKLSNKVTFISTISMLNNPLTFTVYYWYTPVVTTSVPTPGSKVVSGIIQVRSLLARNKISNGQSTSIKPRGLRPLVRYWKRGWWGLLLTVRRRSAELAPWQAAVNGHLTVVNSDGCRRSTAHTALDHV